MKLQKLLSQVEDQEFQANISALSGFRTVLNAFSQIEILQNLISLLKTEPSNQPRVLEFINSKLPDYHADFSHPHDITIAALLYALEQAESNLNLELIIASVSSKQEFFWARYMAQKIYQEKLQHLPQKP